jgi:hypothetical protein
MYEERSGFSRRPLRRIALLVSGLLTLKCLEASALTSVTLAWDASPSAGVTGYRVYYGAASRAYTNVVDAGGATSVTISNLKEGTRYFFAATSRDNLGQESDFSSETNYVSGVISNQPPVISSISNQIVSLDTPTQPLPFTIGDVETPASNLVVTASSDNNAVVAQSGIALGGAASNRTVTVTPVSGGSGAAWITLTVSDGAASTSGGFYVTVLNSRPTNAAPTISAIAGQFIAQNSVAGPLAFTVNDNETSASSLIVLAASSDQVLVPNGNIVLGGNSNNRTVTITPAPGQVGSATITLMVSDGSASASTSFLLTVQSTTFAAAGASYNGLFYEPSEVHLQSAGSFKLTRTVKNTYSGQLKQEGKTYSVSGKLDAFGRGSNSIVRKGQSPLVFLFDCGTSNHAVLGTISDGHWVASVSGDRALFNSKTNPTPWAGSYTLVLPAAQEGADLPQGHSYGTIKVNTSGAVSFAGSLADGTRITQGSSLSKGGMWPFHVSLYSSKGLVLSWLSVTNQASNPDVAGAANWIKLANPIARYYPAGFTNESYAVGSVYLKPVTNTQHIVRLSSAKLKFFGGNLPADFTNQVQIGLSSKIINESTNLLMMSFSLASGTFSGRVLDPVTLKSRSFSGVVLQKYDAGYGMLLGTNLSSQVEFTQ